MEHQKLIEALAACEDDLIAFTSRLVEIPTENPPGKAYRACAELIVQRLAELGLEPALVEIPPGSPELEAGYAILGFYGSEERTLYFHGHYDVVPAVHAAQFQPYVRDGRLFGRGSSDMKSGLAAMIGAVQALKIAGISLQGRVGLTIVADEETGGERGSRYLVEHGMLGQGGIGLLTAEPTSGVVWNANRGAISLRVRVRGKPVHVGLHYEGINAFEQMMVVANALLEYRQQIMTKKTQYRIEPEAARASILMLGGECSGGTNFNLVPAECTFTVDRRINPEEDLLEEKALLLNLFDRLKRQGIDLEVEIFQEAPSAGTSETHTVAQVLGCSIEQAMGRPAVFEMCPGLLENRWYAQQGIPAFAYGPGLLSVSHGPEEYVPIENIRKTALVYALTAVQLLGDR